MTVGSWISWLPLRPSLQASSAILYVWSDASMGSESCLLRTFAAVRPSDGDRPLREPPCDVKEVEEHHKKSKQHIQVQHYMHVTCPRLLKHDSSKFCQYVE